MSMYVCVCLCFAMLCVRVCLAVCPCSLLCVSVCWAVREPFGLGIIAETPSWLCRLLMACLSIIQLAVVVFAVNGMPPMLLFVS